MPRDQGAFTKPDANADLLYLTRLLARVGTVSGLGFGGFFLWSNLFSGANRYSPALRIGWLIASPREAMGAPSSTLHNVNSNNRINFERKKNIFKNILLIFFFKFSCLVFIVLNKRAIYIYVHLFILS